MNKLKSKSEMSAHVGIVAGLVGLTTVSGLTLTATKVAADDVVDNVSITVPISCSMTGTIASGNEHEAEIANGTYQANIGTTSIKALCNDNAGFSIYAIGNSGDTLGEEDSTKLLGTSASGNAKIITGTATTAGNPDVSNWAMKLSTVTDPTPTYPITITSDTEGVFSSYHTVPAEYTKVATRTAGTDVGTSAEGATLTTTYAAYISKTQPADTYTGKVKYVLVHPNDGAAPVIPTASTCNTPVPNLTYMQDLNSSNKASILAGMTEDQQYFLKDKRDEKTYCVARLKDGNIWMTQNLDHDIVTTPNYYTNENTDIGWNGSSYTSTSWTAERATYATGTTTWDDYNRISDPNGVNGYNHPESYDPGDLYWTATDIEDAMDDWDAYYNSCDYSGTTPVCDESLNPTSKYTASTGESNYHLGNYYNWSAAVATNDTSSYTTQYQDLDRSICPANWTLPKSGNNTSNGSFQYLVTQYGWDSSEYTMTNPNIWNTSIKSALAGNWYGSLGYVGDYGGWWSPVVGGSNGAYDLGAASDGGVSPGDDDGRVDGNLVRCIAR